MFCEHRTLVIRVRQVLVEPHMSPFIKTHMKTDYKTIYIYFTSLIAL